jgi:signal transduction histidine kinase
VSRAPAEPVDRATWMVAGNRARPRTPRSSDSAVGLAAGVLVVCAVTLVLYPVRQLDPGVSSGVLYVLGVLLVSVNWGLRLGLITSAASAAALYYFHASPAGFHAKNAGDLVAIGVMLLTACVASLIADSARRRDAERVRLDGVQASRARVMEAADAERRRVVRDLHDGAQQRLVHTVLTLKLAQRELVESGDGAPLLRDAISHAEDAMSELRELAHGILPAVLTRGGLRAGVDALTARMPIPVDVSIAVDRLPAAVESTAYFVVAEALTNVVKHSRAERAEVEAQIARGSLWVSVRDDGVGGARPDGGGLLGLEDRLAVLDGSLEIASRPGGGTLIMATMPVEA